MLKIHNHHISKFSILVVSTDFLLLLFAYFIGIQLRFADSQALSPDFLENSTGALIFALTMMFSMAVMGMYLSI